MAADCESIEPVEFEWQLTSFVTQDRVKDEVVEMCECPASHGWLLTFQDSQSPSCPQCMRSVEPTFTWITHAGNVSVTLLGRSRGVHRVQVVKPSSRLSQRGPVVQILYVKEDMVPRSLAILTRSVMNLKLSPSTKARSTLHGTCST